ncbi:deoxyribose-phosphate aldolase, partial [bacterium]|nr:deoxyribose-phosphate aldolase [bacterium]
CEGHNLKVILETDLLTKEEIKLACEISTQAGADFVKTSTGFIKGGVGAKVEDIKLMYETVSPYGLGVKASGGIKNYKQAIDLINAGASRLGASSGVEIMLGEVQNV